MVEELNSGPPRTNPDSDRVEDLNQGPPDFKSSALNQSATLPPIHYWDGEGTFVRDGIRQAPIRAVHFTKKDLSPNYVCLRKMFSVCECKFQLNVTRFTE